MQQSQPLVLRPHGQKIENCSNPNVQVLVHSMFNSKLTYRKENITELVYVILEQACPLLSRYACVKSGLVTRTEKEINEVTQTPANFKAEFPSLFRGLGKVKTEVYTTLRPDAQPHCLYKRRKIPYLLLPKIKQGLNSMLQQRVIL